VLAEETVLYDGTGMWLAIMISYHANIVLPIVNVIIDNNMVGKALDPNCMYYKH
jgi:hypothetical protein